MVNSQRYLQLNTHSYSGGPVVYWMNRDQRAHDNWALLFAQEKAIEYKVPLLVVFNLDPYFLGGGIRQFDFKIKGLQEVEKHLHALSIPFIVTTEDAPHGIVDFCAKHKAGLLVTDFFPLRKPRAWIDGVRKAITIPLYGVDAHNIVPAWVVSPKQEFAAYTFRPKFHKKVDEFLTDFPRLKKHPYIHSLKIKENNWKKLSHVPFNTHIPAVEWIAPGYGHGMKTLKSFINNRLHGYATKRNDPNAGALSDLSPYFHYGHIAPQRAVYEVLHAHAPKEDKDTFIEEAAVRRELSDNFCFYNPQYDSVEGFPAWAKESLNAHRKDAREYVYTLKQFENAETHDDLWNAAQQEMLQTGKMHGYMRMYWAKKILEWTKSPEDAMKIALHLNDTYELDGRDPNGYVGVAWSIGGVHDRAWFERDVFGKIRYMNKNGCKKKFDVEAYVNKWSTGRLL